MPVYTMFDFLYGIHIPKETIHQLDVDGWARQYPQIPLQDRIIEMRTGSPKWLKDRTMENYPEWQKEGIMKIRAEWQWYRILDILKDVVHHARSRTPPTPNYLDQVGLHVISYYEGVFLYIKSTYFQQLGHYGDRPGYGDAPDCWKTALRNKCTLVEAWDEALMKVAHEVGVEIDPYYKPGFHFLMGSSEYHTGVLYGEFYYGLRFKGKKLTIREWQVGDITIFRDGQDTLAVRGTYNHLSSDEARDNRSFKLAGFDYMEWDGMLQAFFTHFNLPWDEPQFYIFPYVP